MSLPKKTLAALLLLLCAPRLGAAEKAGTLMGWVEDSAGLPIPNVLISLFSKGARGGGFVAFSDSAGRFVLASIPAGSYTLRAVGEGHAPSPARQVTVFADQDSILAISMRALAEVANGEAAERLRELQWLERHKRRSVLEDEGEESSADDAAPGPSPAARFSDMSASLELATEPSASGVFPDSAPGSSPVLPSGSGLVRVNGRLGDSTTFSVGGLLAESGNCSWRTSGNFSVEPGNGHDLQLGVGYGTLLMATPTPTEVPVAPGGVGSAFVLDRWVLSDRVALSGGLRESFIAFVTDRNHVDPSASLEVKPALNSRLIASFGETTIVPGGDLLTVSSLAIGPPIAYASINDDLRAQRTLSYDLAAEQDLTDATVSVRAFRESTRDQLLNVFVGSGADRTVSIVNDGDVTAEGVAFGASEHVGRILRAGVTYEFGHLSQGEGPGFAPGSGTLVWSPDASFRDLAIRLEAGFDSTGTRLQGYYRFDTVLNPEVGAGTAALHTTRFDIQLSQGLPFLATLTRADWDLLLAFRNLFYDAASGGGVLDEVAVANPPKRLLGAISVRF